MGFWDFISPDYDEFVEKVSPWVPGNVLLGPVLLDRATLTNLAWANPASAAGVATRLLYQFGSVQGGNQAAASSLVTPTLDNLVQGGVNKLSPTMVGSDLTQGVSVPQIVIPNVYEATVKMQSGGRAIDNVFHFQGSGPGQEVACATAFQTQWKASGGPFRQFDNKVTLVAFQVVDLSSTSGGIKIIPDNSAGARAVASMATRAACALLTYNGGTRNRNSRGRTYFGPLYEPDVDVDGASLNVVASSTIAGYFSQFRVNMLAAGFAPVVVSRVKQQAYPVAQTLMSTTIATQRRRLRK